MALPERSPEARSHAPRQRVRAIPRHHQSRTQALRRLRQMQEHHAQLGGGSGRFRAAIFGVNDGLVSNASLVVGVAAADPGRQVVLLAGVAGLVAGAFSMAAGEYVSMRVQREVYEAQIAEEERLLEQNPESERQEVSVIFRAKGLPPEDAERVADHVMADPAVALDLMAREELGLNPDDLGSPWGAAMSSFLSFGLGAALPILPFVFVLGPSALLLTLAAAGLALFAVGAATASVSGRPLLFGGGRMLLIGGLAMGVTYLVGSLLGVSVS